jgi:hypothetical protein
MTEGGMLINIGSAVTGPEVFLKAAGMAGNIGKVPHRIITADFDIRPFDATAMSDESKMNYYFRDQKSIVTRVPQAYHGRGYYIQGNQKETFPYFYQQLVKIHAQLPARRAYSPEGGRGFPRLNKITEIVREV